MNETIIILTYDLRWVINYCWNVDKFFKIKYIFFKWFCIISTKQDVYFKLKVISKVLWGKHLEICQTLSVCVNIIL